MRNNKIIMESNRFVFRALHLEIYEKLVAIDPVQTDIKGIIAVEVESVEASVAI